MKIQEARKRLEQELQRLYGTFLELGEVGVLRRSEGRRFAGKVYVTVEGRRLFVGLLEIGMNGERQDVFPRERLIEVIRDVYVEKTQAEEEFVLDLDDDGPATAELTPAQARVRLDELLQKATPEALEEARALYPLLLTNPSTRGSVLHEMALLELALKNNGAAENLLVEAAREYANLAHLEAIERVAERLAKLLGPEAMAAHPVTRILSRTRERLRPVRSLADVPIFKGLPFGLITEMEYDAEDVTFEKGQVVIAEGEPATRCLILRSGTLDVELEGFDGPRIVRSCFPGEFLGENAVLHPPGTVPTTASLRASREPTRAWIWQGAGMQSLMARYPELEVRIRTAKEIHQLDSFFSMHETLQLLDVEVRDSLLACLYTVDTVEPGRILIESGEVPEYVFLVIKGLVHWVPPGGEAPVEFGPDSFVGMRDALHEIAVEGNYEAATESLLAVFDAERLRQLAQDSPPAVVSVLERLH